MNPELAPLPPEEHQQVRQRAELLAADWIARDPWTARRHLRAHAWCHAERLERQGVTWTQLEHYQTARRAAAWAEQEQAGG